MSDSECECCGTEVSSVETLPVEDLLRQALVGRGFSGLEVRVVRREGNVYSSTFQTDVVVCRINGVERRLLVKWGSGHTDEVYGHKGGVPYEAMVYRHLLQPMHTSTPPYYGSCTVEGTDATCLFIEYLAGAIRVNKMPVLDAMEWAATWVGQFHGSNEVRAGAPELEFLNHYDGDYYLGWAQRTCELAGDLHSRHPWLRTLCAGFGEVLPLLLHNPPTVVHGEYTPANVLIREGTVHPVDWESAAVGAGEVDLVMLTADWSPEVERRCVDAYVCARWGAAPPADLERRLDCARLYVGFRWLGDRAEWTHDPASAWVYRTVQSAGERLELI